MKRRQPSEDIASISEEDSKDDEIKSCPICNGNIEIYWEPRYNGMRGRCKRCGINWAES